MERQDIRNALWQFLQGKINQQNRRFHDGKVFNRGHVHTYFQQDIKDWESDKINKKILWEEIHFLVTANILFTGDVGDASSTEPWYTITEFGEECIRSSNILPFDPDGYIKTITQQIPNIDPVVLDYLREAIACYGRQLLLSSTITLGAASEKCIILLIDAFADAISDAKVKADFNKSLDEKGIYKKFDIFKNELKKRGKDLFFVCDEQTEQ